MPQVFATRHPSSFATFKVAGCRQTPPLHPNNWRYTLSQINFIQSQADKTIICRWIQMEVSRYICLIWNVVAYQLFQIKALVLLGGQVQLLMSWSKVIEKVIRSDQGRKLTWKMASKTYIYRDLVTGCEMFNVAHPHVSTIIQSQMYSSNLWFKALRFEGACS